MVKSRFFTHLKIGNTKSLFEKKYYRTYVLWYEKKKNTYSMVGLHDTLFQKLHWIPKHDTAKSKNITVYMHYYSKLG